MKKRFQAFVSSTFEDLKEEREQAMLALLELDCMPAGMELFPAGSQRQWDKIQKVIDDSDFYILIIGGRYGSIDSETGISYTHREFEYAKEQGKDILAFLPEKPEAIPNDKYDSDQTKLTAFKNIVKDGRIIRFYTNKESLRNAITASVALLQRDGINSTGWVKFDRDIGIESITFGQGTRNKMQSLIDTAKDIKVIFVSGRGFIEDHSSKLRKAIRRGCNISVLAATPESEFVKDLHSIQQNNSYVETSAHSLNEELKALSAFFRLNKLKEPRSTSLIVIGHYRTHFRANVFIFEDKNNKRIGFYLPTLPPSASNTAPCFDLIEGDLLDSCLAHFNSIMDDLSDSEKEIY